MERPDYSVAGEYYDGDDGDDGDESEDYEDLYSDVPF